MHFDDRQVMATVPAVMILYDRGLIDLDARVAQYLPEFAQAGKEGVTVRMLLTHTAGLREFHPFFDMGLTTRRQVLEFILADKLWYAPGGAARYSDLSMIVLALVAEAITRQPLQHLVQSELHSPLEMRHTGFRPLEESEFEPLAVPTEVDALHRRRLLWGEAWILGGVSGHAGLFSTVVDVCRFAQMVLAGGMDLRSGRRFFSEATLRLFTTPDAPTPGNPRPFALGWDVSTRRGPDGYTSAGQYMGPRTFGHTGFTGTSLWIDPDRNLFVVMLTNAVHPSVAMGSGNKLRELRPAIADAAVLAMAEQQLPRELLTWHLGSHTRGSRPLHDCGDHLAAAWAGDAAHSD
eukprot:jgi/Mesen1/4840/ME000244S04023